jgi:hypothetical protein
MPRDRAMTARLPTMLDQSCAAGCVAVPISLCNCADQLRAPAVNVLKAFQGVSQARCSDGGEWCDSQKC